jgi:hypothetical protein
MADLRRLGLFASLWAALTGAIVSGASAQQGAPSQFTSGGLQVAVNRAVLNPAGGLVMSLVLTNPRDDGVEIFLATMPRIIADVGGMAAAAHVSGLPFCDAYEGWGFSGCLGAIAGTRQEQLSPTVIDANNSITVTLFFPTRPSSKVCSVDFSMLAGMRRIGGRSQDPWRQITIGLPNIRVC